MHIYLRKEIILNRVIDMKPNWETPELIVLERSQPQEAVLDACKIKGECYCVSNPWAYFANCYKFQKKATGCGWECSTTLCSTPQKY